MNPDRIPLALDSGAYSLYNQIFIPKAEKFGKIRGRFVAGTNYDYITTPQFKKYFDGYLAFVTKYGKYFEFVVTLDIIFNPQATWDLFREIKALGLNVLPVYHHGEDPKWLKKYMDETDYIGMSGLGNMTKRAYVPFGDASWKILCNAKGVPLRKVHGFAMSSFDLMSRWPWYSVDSTTAFTFSRMGAITLPHRVGNGFNYAVTPAIFPVSVRRGKSNRHIGHRGEGHVKEAVLTYLSEVQLTLEDVAESYVARDIANLHFMNQSMRAISKTHSERIGQRHDIFYYASGAPTGSHEGLLATIEHLRENDSIDHICYLGTFFSGQSLPIRKILNHYHGVPTLRNRMKASLQQSNT